MIEDDTYRTPAGKNVFEFANFEEYLSSLATKEDKNYLEDIEIARTIVQLGFRGPREGFTEEQFNALKLKYETRKQAGPVVYSKAMLTCVGKTYKDAVMRALQMREEGNRSGKNQSIFFLRMYNDKGHEVSAYIDYAHRLATQDFGPIFELHKRFLPQKTDLSFLNWETSVVTWNNSPNYEVIANSVRGMVFRNKKDNKIVNPDTYGSPGDNSSRTILATTEYLSAFVLDHYRR